MEIWSFLRNHGTAIGVVASLITILGAVWWFGRPLVSWAQSALWVPIREARFRQPKRTLVVQPGERRATFWADVSAGNEQSMMVQICLHLTNVAMVPVQISSILLQYRRWGIASKQQEGDFDVYLERTDRFGKFPVEPGRMLEAVARWQIPHPFQRPKKSIRVRVELVDQFGNRCRGNWMTVYFVDDPRRFY